MLLEAFGPGLLWFLLPVAAASGWLIAKREQQGQAGSGAKKLSRDYFRGIDYVLNEQPDRAIEVFINMLDVDSETVETHLALGNLFRRRGEVDRAIRIHQNLIARPNLVKEQRGLAVLELGKDYMGSGLLDRAESLFRELLELGMYKSEALQYLVNIYQQEQDWEKAVEVTRELSSETGVNTSSSIAHFYSEQADTQVGQGNLRQAAALVKEALKVDPSCVRASLAAGQIAMTEGRFEEAILAFRRVEQQDGDFLPEAIHPLVACYREVGRLDELVAYLHKVADNHAGITPVLVLAELAAERGDLDQAIKYIDTELRQRPSVRGLDRMVEYSLAQARDEGRDNLVVLREFTSELLADSSVYQCRDCGFTGKSLHWQCPSCKNWNSVKPIHGIAGE